MSKIKDIDMKFTVADFRRYAAQPCEWSTEFEDFPVWETSCGNSFQFDMDGPVENGMKYCPYCGRRLTTASTGQGGDSALEDGSDPEVLSTPE